MIELFGIRHHGPGSARSLLAALEAFGPDALCVEGPPDGDPLLELILDAGLVPPVALLVYRPDEPARAVYYPFAEFSPEWQALRWAAARGIPSRFMDLPMAHRMAMRIPRPRAGGEEIDPIASLGQAAGYDDPERWWELVVEERRDPEGVFAAILEAMAAVRGAAPPAEGEEALREAWMRRTIRAVEKQGAQRIAVVCGAWHAPVLAGRVRGDDALLKGLPKVKTAATWVPWTYGRLTFASGYGAGVRSPGWYDHLWQTRDGVAVRWMTHVARLLRAADLDASSGHVIDAVRLAEALAALRGRAVAGLEELNQATQAVLAGGSELPLAVVHDKLVVGERLGAVPEGAPQVPLARDLAAQRRRLRLKQEAEERLLELDLRRPIDLERSQLLHRLSLLGIRWGEPEESMVNSLGTFREHWRLAWDPDLAVAVIEAGMWGNTALAAATACARDQAEKATTLARLGELLDLALLAALPEAATRILARLDELGAVIFDVLALLGALPPLARTLRYGDVRKTDSALIAHLVDGLVARASVGLPAAVASLDDAAARQMEEAISAVHAALALVGSEAHHAAWRGALEVVSADARVHGLVAGRALRLLLDGGTVAREEVLRRTGLALTAARPPEQAAAWAEGFLRGSGLLLLHDDALWEVVDRWLSGLDGGAFVSVLPLVRRTFAALAPAERHEIGERAARGGRPGARAAAASVDEARAAAALATARRILGRGALPDG
jgi:hypothetical protein